MKIISFKITGTKKRVVVECAPGEQLIAVRQDAFYKLGYPHEDIVAADRLFDARPVYWCDIEQKWKE